MTPKQPLSIHIPSLMLEPSNTFEELDSDYSTQSPSATEYASEEENAKFHEEFPGISKEERLVVCIDNKPRTLYVTEGHVYYTNHHHDLEKGLIPIRDMTAVYIQWNTSGFIGKFRLTTRYIQFDTWFAKETVQVSNDVRKAFDIICSRWRAFLQRTDASQKSVDHRDSTSRQTLCECLKEDRDSHILVEGVFLGTPNDLHQLLFMSEAGKDYMHRGIGWYGDLSDIQISDWMPASIDAPQGHLVQTLHSKYHQASHDIHNEVIHYAPDESISVVSKETLDSWKSCSSRTQCFMWESVKSSRFIVRQNEGSSDFHPSLNNYLLLADDLCLSFCEPVLQTSSDIQKLLSLETVGDILFALKKSRIRLTLALILAEAQTSNLDSEYYQKCIKWLCLLAEKHQILPPSLLTQDRIHILVDLDQDRACPIQLSSGKTLKIRQLLDLLLTEVKISKLNHEYHERCTKWLSLLVKKYNLSSSLCVQDNITTFLMELDSEAIYSIFSTMELSRIPQALDLLLNEAKASNVDHEYYQKCTHWLCLLVHKNGVTPPSLFTQEGVRTVLVDLDPATTDFILLTINRARIPKILNILLAETKAPNMDREYYLKCTDWLCLLIKKHNISPPSLCTQDGLHTLMDLDPEITNFVLLAIKPARIPQILNLLLTKREESNGNYEYCQKSLYCLRLLVRKHSILPSSLSIESIPTVLVDLDPETANTILFALKPPKIPQVLDVLLSEVKMPNSNYEYIQRCRSFLHLLVKKHGILPPSLFTLGAFVDLDPESTDTILFALEPIRIPPVLDVLLTEAKTSKLDQQYCRKCTKWLRLLVNKHYVLPPSLFVKDVTAESSRVVAVGGYSDIYKGSYRSKTVCLKVLKIHIEDGEEKKNKDLLEFYKETLLWTQLNHANILPFLGVNTTLFPGKLALVAPWMGNGEITKFLKVNPNYDRLRVISEIAAGIMYLHSRNIVHGDIKGANVLVDEQGQCYLADFGLATAAMTSTLLSTTTNSGGKGTMRWMAPELFASEEVEFDEETTETMDEEPPENPKPDNVKLARDIYAYACTVYEIVAEKIPFAHLKHDAQVMLQVLNGKRPGRPTVTPWCPNNIWALVQQCWVQESHLRPTAAGIHAFLVCLGELRTEGLPWEEEFPNFSEAEK